jgi:hypothetical protein
MFTMLKVWEPLSNTLSVKCIDYVVRTICMMFHHWPNLLDIFIIEIYNSYIVIFIKIKSKVLFPQASVTLAEFEPFGFIAPKHFDLSIFSVPDEG